jgi:hypothetical protein|tara:strand:- start:8 stop:610 length:603 start_codon:yes stop_codon:yes gene_type:complete
MIDTTIEFGGFYDSIHSSHIDMTTENYFDDTPLQNDDNNFEYFNWSAIHQSYIESYVNKLSDYITDNYQIDIDFKKVSLDSPTQYNFKTDVINCSVNKKKIELLNNKLIIDDEFAKYLKDSTQSYDGYMSFYTYQQALNNKDDILSVYVLRYICHKLNSEYLDIEYDIILTDEGNKKLEEYEKVKQKEIEFESKQLKLQL